MRFAICNELFEGWEWNRICKAVSQIGYRGLEIAPFTLGPTPIETSKLILKTMRQQAVDNGLEIVGLHWLLAKTQHYHLTSSDSSTRQRTANYMIDLISLCRELGGNIMVFGSPLQRSLDAETSIIEGNQRAQEVIEAMIPALERNRIVLALEPLGPGETNFWVTADEVNTFVKTFNSPHVKLNLDVKAMATEAKPIAKIIQSSREHLVHFHANDPNRLGPGMGSVEYRDIVDALSAVDYRGWLSVEVFDYSPGPIEIAQKSFDYLQHVFQNS